MRRNSRLTVRIFLITCFLLLTVGGIICGAIAYLTPRSYTSLLESELLKESQALVNRLSAIPRSESIRELNEFARRTGACLRLTDAQGEILFDTLPDASMPAQDSVTVQEPEIQLGICAEDSAAAIQKDASITGDAVFTDDGSAVTGVIEQALIFSFDHSLSIYPVRFSDGHSGELMIQRGLKEVNQVMEVLKEMFPFLLAVVLCVSLLGAAIYAAFITKPVIALSKIAGRMADLDFSAHWGEKRRDEIGALGASLNTLSENLSSTLDQLRAANAALQADIDREKELERQRTAFFAAASHELKTPVTILKGQLSGMLAQVGIYRDREKYLSRSLEVTGRMEKLIQEILVISRIESDAFPIGKEQIDFSLLVRQQLSSDAEILEEKQLTSRIHAEPNIYIVGSRSLLSNALDNIYMNAILYSPPGASVLVDLTQDTLRVENTGAFIPESQLSSLFTPFFRGEPSRNRKTGGSGLGLYLVKSIFSLHGISCEIGNTPNGVRFTAHLKNSRRISS